LQSAHGHAPRAQASTHLPNAKKKDTTFVVSFFLSMGYEKGIFGSFVYDFELSHFYQTTFK